MTFAIVGAIVLAGTGAFVGVRSAPSNNQVAGVALTSTQPPSATDTPQVALPTATAVEASPTATPAIVATQTALPVPTANPTATPGGVVTVNGSIQSVNSSAGTFGYRIFGGTTVTVVTNASTQFTGAATSFSGLRTGLRAHVTGTYQPNGTLLATRVSSSVDN